MNAAGRTDTTHEAKLLRARFAGGGLAHLSDYPREMFIEALAEWEHVDPGTGWIETARAACAAEGPVRATRTRDLFASADDAIARAAGDTTLGEAFVRDTARMLDEMPLDPDGLMLHPLPAGIWGIPAGRRLLLVDSMQEYASRLASAAALGGDPAWFDVALRQFDGYRRILRDPLTGLWHLGRDWGIRAGTLSPGAWSRGHGWLLRGMVETLRWLPARHPGRSRLAGHLREALDAVRPLQDAEGMWHVLLHRPEEQSEAETTGTALIAYAIARAVSVDILDAAEWAPVGHRAIAAIRRRIDDDGVVSQACVGPGLLLDDGESLYLGEPSEPDDPHGPPCALYGLLAERLLPPAAG